MRNEAKTVDDSKSKSTPRAIASKKPISKAKKASEIISNAVGGASNQQEQSAPVTAREEVKA
jgi:hypothetical protein